MKMQIAEETSCTDYLVNLSRNNTNLLPLNFSSKTADRETMSGIEFNTSYTKMKVQDLKPCYYES